jgi:hypothetical protein
MFIWIPYFVVPSRRAMLDEAVQRIYHHVNRSVAPFWINLTIGRLSWVKPALKRNSPHKGTLEVNLQSMEGVEIDAFFRSLPSFGLFPDHT